MGKDRFDISGFHAEKEDVASLQQFLKGLGSLDFRSQGFDGGGDGVIGQNLMALENPGLYGPESER